jgi:hypothetical protein
VDSYTKCDTLPRDEGNRDTGLDFNHDEEVLAMMYRELSPRRGICSPRSEGKD